MNPLPEIDLVLLRTWIGRQEIVHDFVTEDLARKYHATMDYGGEAPLPGQAVPRLIHLCLAQPAAAAHLLGPDGHPRRGGFLPPVPLPRRMWAGGSFVFHDDLKVGQAVKRTSTIENVVLKEGRTGRLCFVTVKHVIEADGAAVVEERQDIVYRDVEAPGDTPAAPPQSEIGEVTRPMRAEAPLLFRYSALTFNGHRIHYDRRYSTEVEGYPGLIVHGPLQAALLCDFAGELRGKPPTRFEFRGFSPLFDIDAFSLHATEAEGSLRLWTAKNGGPLCMGATAYWD
ncbi:MaoC family dehydratase N-terminal domain-containing protein [Chelatococcus sp. GCM10030263]|uniref:FAS1-like dehydratase domain-containing protein n=1 Tax=Chelatococcus sp. GCM10030263 TaxID=3273387 RepID=UPI0036216F45